MCVDACSVDHHQQLTALGGQELANPPCTWKSGVKTVWPISSINYPGEKKKRAGFRVKGQS